MIQVSFRETDIGLQSDDKQSLSTFSELPLLLIDYPTSISVDTTTESQTSIVSTPVTTEALSTEPATTSAADTTMQAMTTSPSETSPQVMITSVAETSTLVMTTSPDQTSIGGVTTSAVETSTEMRTSIAEEISTKIITTVIPQISTQEPLAISTSPAPNITSTPIVLLSTAKVPTPSPAPPNQSKYQNSKSDHQPLSLCLACSPPTITLIPDTSSFASPLAFRRSQDVSVSSYLQLQCNGSLATIIRWTITQCTPTCSSSALQLPLSIETTLSELFLPARTLDYGTYQLTLAVTMAAAPQSTSTAMAYLKITPTPITPNLMPFGTSMIAHGRSQDLLLDPGTNSVDPDADIFNATVSIPLIHRNGRMRSYV